MVTVWLPSDSSVGLLGTSKVMPPSASCCFTASSQLVTVTLMGSNAAITLLEVGARCVLAVWWSFSISTTFIARVAPTSSQKELRILAV